MYTRIKICEGLGKMGNETGGRLQRERLTKNDEEWHSTYQVAEYHHHNSVLQHIIKNPLPTEMKLSIIKRV